MASTIVATTLTVTISETISLNSQDINSINTLAIGSINEIDKRIITVPFASEINVLLFDTTASAGVYKRADVKYIRITNKDSLNFIRITLIDSSGALRASVKIEAGRSFIICSPVMSATSTGSAFATFSNLQIVSAQADTAPVDVEFVVASI